MLFNIGKFYVLCTEIIHLNVKKKNIYIKYVFTNRRFDPLKFNHFYIIFLKHGQLGTF
jgi:hypothetical protein